MLQQFWILIVTAHILNITFRAECSEPFEDVYLQFGTSEGRGSKDPYHADNQGYNERLLAQSVKNRNRNRRLKPQGRGYSKNGNENYYNGQNEYRNTQNDNQGDNHIDKDTNYGQHGPISRNYGGYHNTRGNGPRKRVINPENLQIMYNMLSHLLQNLPASRNNQGNNRGGLCPLMGGLCVPRQYCQGSHVVECGGGAVCCSAQSDGVKKFKHNQERDDDDYNDIGGLVTDDMRYK